MCAVVGSKDTNTLKELITLNSYRGCHSYSFSVYNTYTGVLHILKKKLGTINLDSLNVPTNCYGIVHIQAPTTDVRGEDNIHPATIPTVTSDYPFYALWHNGIIKEEIIKRFKDTLSTSWDTKIILELLNRSQTDWDVLNKMDGTFSCLFYDGLNRDLKLFRNQISPMFIDEYLNISSTRFESSIETEPDVVFSMNLDDNTLNKVGEFKTVENPYFFGA